MVVLFSGAPSAYSNMGLSHSYPAGSFEAIEALTFVTEPSWQKALVQARMTTLSVLINHMVYLVIFFIQAIHISKLYHTYSDY